MIKIELSAHQFQELIKANYSLDIVFLLKCLESGLDLDKIAESSTKMASLLQNINRKNLINDGKLTLEGKSVMDFLSNVDVETKFVKKKADEDWFNNWWKAYPASDTFTYNGRTFNGSRALRTKKDDCKAKLNKILLEGDYTIEDLIDAIKLETHQKAEMSVKTGQNKMSYMQNSMTYLNQRTFESYVELVKAGHKVKEESKTPTGGVEI